MGYLEGNLGPGNWQGWQGGLREVGFDPRLPSEEPLRALGCCSLSLGLPAQVRKRAKHGLLETDLIILACLSGG